MSVHQGLSRLVRAASLVSDIKAKKAGSQLEIDGKIVNEGKKEAYLTISKSAILATADDFFLSSRINRKLFIHCLDLSSKTF